MKKIIYIIISLIALIGCAENTYILDPTLPLEDTEVENPFKHCFNIISIATGHPQCPDVLTLKVVTCEDFQILGTTNRSINKLIICVTNDKYVFNDFRLGQTLCDLSIYN